MKLQVEKLENNKAKLIVEVSDDLFNKGIEAVYNQSKNKINIPGFRKGKVSRNVIERIYGKEFFYQDAANHVLEEAYNEAYEDCQEDIVSEPTIDLVQLEYGKPFIFSAEVTLKPPVKLGQYKEIEVPVSDTEVTDDEVLEELEKERKKNKRTVTVEGRPVEDGDVVVVDFEGFLDGVAFDGGKGENHPLKIGSGEFIPGFEEQLIGVNAGETKEVNVTFPEEYHSEELAGKAVVFKCEVLEIKAEEFPELNDEFAEEVSEFETLDQFKADLKEQLQKKKENIAKQEKEKAILNKILENAELEVPEEMIALRQKLMIRDFEQRLYMQGMDPAQYYQYAGASRSHMFEEIRPEALKQIQYRLLLEAVAAAENLTASEEEINTEIEKLSEAYNETVEQIRERMGKKGYKEIAEDTSVQKALDFLLENAVEK